MKEKKLMNQLVKIEYTMKNGYFFDIVYTNGYKRRTNVLGHYIKTEEAFTEQLILN